jgi:hypothetical protein
MKGKKIRRIALAAALAGSVFIGVPETGFTQTAPQVLASLSDQVEVGNFAQARATIDSLQQMGIGALVIGSERISLFDLLAMIAAAESGQMDPAALASYFDALAASTAVAVFVPLEENRDPEEQRDTLDDRNTAIIPTGSEG